MTRAWCVIGVVFLGGVMAMGCGSSTSAMPTSTTAPKEFRGSTQAWLTTEAHSWNQTLNEDQASVLRASRAKSETDASAFFSHLASVCGKFQRDARRAQELPQAPSAALESAWRSMTVATEAYATSCLKLTRTRSNAALTQWNATVEPMDLSNAALNTVVARARSAASSVGG